MSQLHHGITAREAAIGKSPLRNADTNTIAMLAFADDADETVFPLNTPVLVTSINRILPKAGTSGNLRKNLEIISAITSPTLVVIRIRDPFNSEKFEQALVIGTTDESGRRTGLQALLTVKSVLGITPKIICVSDTETIDVANALGAICKKLRAYAYITPRNETGEILPTAEDVTIYREKLAFREIQLIWPEWTNSNVLLGSDEMNNESIKEALKQLQKLNVSVEEISNYIKQELPETSFEVEQDTVPRFSADCWTIDGPRSMSFCLVGEADDAFDVYFTSRRQNDFAAAIFFSEDQAMHSYLSYETKKDFTDCTLSFSIDIGGDVPSIDDEHLGLVMTIIANDDSDETGQSSYYLRLANLADPATLTATHADITIDWNTAVSGYEQNIPFPKENIHRIFIGCLTNGFNAELSNPLERPQQGELHVSKIRCTGSNSTYKRKSLSIPQHTLGMCTGYDDSYNVNPARLIKNCYDLGYRGFINHYCGMSHFYDSRWDADQQRFVVRRNDAEDQYDSYLNREAAIWHTHFARAAHNHFMKMIFSISYEIYSEAAELSWTQRDWDNNYAYTGYEPPSYLLSPCIPEGMNWLQQVFVEFANILHDEGHIPYLQVGEPWWWINADGKPCIYDYPTKLKFNQDTGLYAPEITDRMSDTSGTTEKAYLEFLQDQLGQSVRHIRLAVKESYPEAQVSTLFFLPSILGEGSGIASIMNYPIEHYRYPNLDFIQTETYDWLIVGEFNKALRGFTSAIDELGYPADLVHYLAGFVPDDFLGKLVNPEYDLIKDGPKVWQAIMGNAYLGKEYNVAKQYIWAYNQIMRDSLVILPEDRLKKFWLADKQYMSQIKEHEVNGTPNFNWPFNPTRPPEPEEPLIEEPLIEEPELPKPDEWDIQYLVNGEWIHEATPATIVWSDDRYNLYSSKATELVIGDGIIGIETGAFQNWTSAISLTIPNSLTTIGEQAFMGWTSIQSVVIPESVTYIRQNAFANWKACLEITMLGTVPPSLENNYAFQNLKSTCVIKVPAASLTEYKTAPYWSKLASKIVEI